MTEQRRSRLGWTAFQKPPSLGSKQRWRSAWMVASILNMILSVLLFAYVVVLNNAANGETARIQQQVQQNNCALLDNLPARFPLQRLRDTYHCGPGLPSTQP